MKRLGAIGVAVLVIVGAGSSCRHKFKLGNLDKKEWIVLPVGVYQGACSLLEREPAELRTEGDSQVTWIVVGSCPAKNGQPQTIEIKRQFMKGGQSFDLFVDGGTKLKDDIPTSEGPGVHLRGKLKPRNAVAKGRYRYTIFINGQEAQWRSRADDGDFFLCPVWPCGDFRE